MRPIEFRGYNLRNEVWLYGHYFVNRGRHFIVTGDELDNPLSTLEDFEITIESLGQYTGLKDKNGVEIYEGDIFKAPNPTFYLGPEVNLEIKFHSGTFYYLYNDHIQPLGWEIAYGDDEDAYITSYSFDKKIVGNIYEHPNLFQQ